MISRIRKINRPRDLLLVFELLAILLMFVYSEKNFDRYTLGLSLGLIVLIYASNIVLGKVTTGDNYIFLIVSMLITIGIVITFRVDQSTGFKQLIWSLTGILVFYVTYFIVKYFKNLENMSNLYLILSIGLFVFTILFGTVRNGAKNWILISKSRDILVQPSEFIKILLMFIVSSFYFNYKKYKKYKHSSYILMGVMYLFVGLLFLQKDLGTAVIFLAIYMGIQFVYDENRKSILVNLGLLAVGAIVGYIMFTHVKSRVSIWLDPWSGDIPYNKGSQIVQSLFAISEGGFLGTGIGRGFPQLIYANTSDSIFPIICEEMGILTGIGIIMLYMLLVYRGVKIALEQEHLFYRILALCVSILFAIQSFLNIGGITKLIPMTGLTLPFISYGGSSMISSFIALAILQVASEDLSAKYYRGD